LRNKEIYRKKGKGVFRIICLGASPTFGWGVNEDQMYSYRLQQLLNDNPTLQKDIEVINAGVIGYSSYQGLNFFREKIIDYAPDLITVSYVINDVDKHRFYRSNGKPDKDLEKKNEFWVTLENFLYQSKTVTLLNHYIMQRQSAAIKNFGKQGKSRYNETRRVSVDEYRANLKAIIQIARQNGIRVILIKMPVNLPAAENISTARQLQADSSIERALAFASTQRFDESIKALKEAILYNPYSSKAFYYLGQYSEHIKDENDAQEYFKQALKMELFECEKLGKVYNKVMEEVAAEENVVLVDIVSEFAVYKEKHKTPLFLEYKKDTIHPNPIGHQIISQAIYKILMNNAVLFKKNDVKI